MHTSQPKTPNDNNINQTIDMASSKNNRLVLPWFSSGFITQQIRVKTSSLEVLEDLQLAILVANERS